jgi:Uncharacterized protein conserved in bacteria (DUF2130)
VRFRGATGAALFLKDLAFDKYLSLGGRSEEISQICVVWGKAVAVSRYQLYRGYHLAKIINENNDPSALAPNAGVSCVTVFGHQGQVCGTILWESKRTKNWNDGWLTKLRDDQRTAKAEVALIASTALPKGTEAFDPVDNVWVAEPRFAIPLDFEGMSALAQSRCSWNSRNPRLGGESQGDALRSFVPDFQTCTALRTRPALPNTRR